MPKSETQFKAGNPGGPGFPKGKLNMTLRFRNYLEKISRLKAPDNIVQKLQERFPEIKNGVTLNELEAFMVHVAALEKEPWAYDRLHGKPRQQSDYDPNEKDEPIQHNLIYKRKEPCLN